MWRSWFSFDLFHEVFCLFDFLPGGFDCIIGVLASLFGFVTSLFSDFGGRLKRCSGLFCLFQRGFESDFGFTKRQRIFLHSTMFTARRKLRKKEGENLTPLETQVAQALFDLETGTSDLKNELRDLQIITARELTSLKKEDDKKSIVIFIPTDQVKEFRRIQARLVRELEKKFSGRPVVLLAQRRIIRKPPRNSRKALEKRPYSRTVAAVHQAILEDLVYPTEIVGKRIRYRLDGSSVLKIQLDPRDKQSTEYKLDTFNTVYKKVTGKNALFEYPVVVHEINH